MRRFFLGFFCFYFSISAICFILFKCLFSLLGFAERNAFSISSAFFGLYVLPPRQIMFAWLCSLAALAVNLSKGFAALIPFILFAAMLIPIPVPHISIPRDFFSLATAFATFSAFSG